MSSEVSSYQSLFGTMAYKPGTFYVTLHPASYHAAGRCLKKLTEKREINELQSWYHDKYLGNTIVRTAALWYLS